VSGSPGSPRFSGVCVVLLGRPTFEVKGDFLALWINQGIVLDEARSMNFPDTAGIGCPSARSLAAAGRGAKQAWMTHLWSRSDAIVVPTSQKNTDHTPAVCSMFAHIAS